MKPLLAAAGEFVADYVSHRAALWARDGHMALEALREAGRRGLLSVEVPREQGGHGAGFLEKLKFLDLLSRHSFDFAFSLINTANVAARIATEVSPQLRERYLPRLLSGDLTGGSALTEPQAGSDFAAIKTRAARDGDGWRLTGEKAWITNAEFGGLFFVYAQTDESKGWRGIGCFIVDATRPGFVRKDREELLQGGTIGAGGFALQNYFVEAGEVLSPPGDAFKRAMASVNQARTYVAHMCVAMVDECLQIALAHGRTRTAFGGTLAEKQGWRRQAGDIATDIEAARLLTMRAAQLIETKDDAALAAAFAKKFATSMAVQRISDACQLMGAAGLREIYPFTRHMASARIANYTDGSTEMQNERIAALVVDARSSI